jgi:Domain of unknown function (DUF4470)
MAMLHPVYGAPKQWLYATGNTPATCLTQDLPPGAQANCLLLGCGDPRNILLTICSEEAKETEANSGIYPCKTILT